MTPSRKVGTRCLAIMEQLAGGVGDSGRGLMLADALMPLLQQSAASRYIPCAVPAPVCYATKRHLLALITLLVSRLCVLLQHSSAASCTTSNCKNRMPKCAHMNPYLCVVLTGVF